MPEFIPAYPDPRSLNTAEGKRGPVASLPWRARRFLAVLAILIAQSGIGDSIRAAEAAESCALPNMKTAERPGAGGAATKVAVGLYLVDITQIDDVKQEFTADFLLFQTWKDPRLNNLEGCYFNLDQVWSPNLDFVNSGRVFPGFPTRVRVGPEGAVRYVQRYRGSLSFPHRLDDFPFDRHTLRVALVTIGHRLHDIELTVDKKTNARHEALTIPDWIVGTPRGLISTYVSAQTGENLPQFFFEIPVERRYGYYFWKMLLPLVLIVAMSWSVFWINPAQFGPQIGMAATSMLTLIAFQFATTGILPRLSYVTALDAFITASTGLVFLALVESLMTAYYVSVDRKELALRIDKNCRWIFPLAFIGIIIAIFAI